jgi:hypothetical protein
MPQLRTCHNTQHAVTFLTHPTWVPQASLSKAFTAFPDTSLKLPSAGEAWSWSVYRPFNCPSKYSLQVLWPEITWHVPIVVYSVLHFHLLEVIKQYNLWPNPWSFWIIHSKVTWTEATSVDAISHRLCIYLWFNETLSSSSYIQYNYWTVIWKGVGWKSPWPNLRYYFGTCLETGGNPHNHKSKPAVHSLNQGPHKYKVECYPFDHDIQFMLKP